MASFIDFLKKSALNIPVTRGAGDKVWGYTYVEDLSQLIVQTCEAPVTRTRAFNIAAGEYTLHQIRDIILKLNPEAQVTVEGGTGGHSWLPRLDTTGVRTELGWQPKYGVEEGLRKTMNYFRQQEGLPLL
jgi:nucleoside-diphosphate-sugar epimerase